MSAGNRQAVDPAMQAWVDRQKAKFSPADLDRVVVLWRSWDREDRATRGQRGAA
ncbi:hypothetical protein [Nocardia sp. NPDC049149]|uniref:hypothetical protein n=1 Tax=Nocardia sp. NPDC049149 TaxID=3364315 RepID=UPI003713F53B